MKRLKYFLFTLFCSSCLATPSIDSFLPVGDTIKTEIVNSQVFITWIRFEDPKQVEEECERIGLKAKPGYNILACAHFDIEKQTCTIFTLNPKTLNDERTTLLGHEVKHCFDGAYHD